MHTCATALTTGRSRQHGRVTVRLTAAFLCIIAMAAPCAAQAGKNNAFSDVAVEAAIDKAVKYLWSQQRPNGSWPPFGKLPDHYYPVGPSAMTAYALLKSGVKVDDARMARALRFLASAKTQKTYSLGLRANCWLAASKQDKKYRRLLRKDASQLVKSTRDGSYTYESRGEGKSSGDHSNSQYGVLGVWAGAAAHMEIPQAYWWTVLRHWIGVQHGDGGWGYSNNGTDPSRGTMTAAGLATLFVCYDNLLSASTSFVRCKTGQRAALAQLPIKRGLEWFKRNYGVYDGNCYYLYGVERVGLASGYKYFGKIDWYKQGAEGLVKSQGPDGSWGGVPNTCFAVLFLIRGRNPVMFNKLDFAGDWNNRPRDLASLTRWVSGAFEGTVNWQIINLSVPVSEWHDAPILYISGAETPTFSDEHVNKLRKYVHEGGTIFSVTECGGAGFRKGIRELYKRLFPNYTMVQVPQNHALRNIHFRLRGKPKLFMIDNGVRAMVIHTDDDLTLHWQLRAEATKKWAFEAAANIFLYVNDKQTETSRLRKRGTTLWPTMARFTPKARVKLARIKYEGNYDPEPLAFVRFALMMGRQTQTQVDVTEPIATGDLAASGAKLAVLVGTGKFTLLPREQKDIKAFIASGGTLLIDAAGGDEPGEKSNGFTKAVQALMSQMYPGKQLTPLAGAAPVYQIKGMEIHRARWRRGTKIKMSGIKTPLLRGLFLGDRPAIIFSREDITAGLLGVTTYSVYGYDPGGVHDPGMAFRLMRNIALWAGKVGK